MKLIRLAICWLAIAIIFSTVFTLTIGQELPIEFKDTALQSDYYLFAFSSLPIAILLTLLGTIRKKNKKARNGGIIGLTIVASVIAFFILTGVMFSIGFGAWVNETILYRNKANRNITINQQIYDIGALGYSGHRTVELKPFLKFFLTIKKVDTAKIDSTKWDFVDEPGDIKY